MKPQKKLIIFSDGGSRGNPGPAACAIVVYDPTKKKIIEAQKFLGPTTNNQAEYAGVILGLEEALKFQAEEIDFYLDSLLVVNQLKLVYKVKEPLLQPVFLKAWNLSSKFKKITWNHVSREKNQVADSLVNQCLDQSTK